MIPSEYRSNGLVLTACYESIEEYGNLTEQDVNTIVERVKHGLPLPYLDPRIPGDSLPVATRIRSHCKNNNNNSSSNSSTSSSTSSMTAYVSSSDSGSDPTYNPATDCRRRARRRKNGAKGGGRHKQSKPKRKPKTSRNKNENKIDSDLLRAADGASLSSCCVSNEVNKIATATRSRACHMNSLEKTMMSPLADNDTPSLVDSRMLFYVIYSIFLNLLFCLVWLLSFHFYIFFVLLLICCFFDFFKHSAIIVHGARVTRYLPTTTRCTRGADGEQVE